MSAVRETGTAPYTVAAADTPGLPEIVASLPLSLAPAGTVPEQLASIAGTSGWAARAQAALDGGAAAAVVGSPTTHDGAAGLAEAAAPRVVLAWDFAANPGVLAAAAFLDDALLDHDAALDNDAAPLRDRAVLAEATLTVPSGTDLDAALLDALTAVVRIAGDATPLRTLHRDAAGWHLAGELAGRDGTCGTPLSVAIVITDAVPAALRVRVLTDEGGLTAFVPSPDTAVPAEVRTVGPEGELLLPTLWETSRRASWRRAVAIAAGDSLSGDLAELHRITKLAPAQAG